MRSSGRIQDVRTNRDLAVDLLGADFLTIRKVKAHNERQAAACSDLHLKWATEGNTAADLAAKAARGREMGLLLQLSDTVAERYLRQRDCLRAFGRYLVDLNLAEAKFRAALAPDKTAQQPTEEEVTAYGSLLEHWDYRGGCLAPESIFLESLESFPMGRDFGASLQTWSCQLKWPALPVTSEEELGVTFLELLTHYVVWSRRLPPILLYDNQQARYIAHDDPAAWLLPNSIHTCVGSFQAALVKFKQTFQVDLVPGPIQRGLLHLRRLGLEAPQTGLALRPVFPQTDGWIALLRRVCSDSRVAHLEGWLNLPSFS